MPAYCNITTDLQDVFSRIEEYQAKEVVKNWTLVSSTIYKKAGTGFVSMVFWNGTQLVAHTTSSVTAGRFYYDADVDILYVNNSADPDDSNIVEAGVDWDGFKTIMRNRAMEIVDSYLNKKYTTPLVPRDDKTHSSGYYYEWPIVEATACITCALIIKRVSPNDSNGVNLFKRAINPRPGTDENIGLLDMYIAGELARQDEITPREVGNWAIYAKSTNTGSDSPQIRGTYTGSYYRKWVVKVDTGGAPGTGTYKVSYDNGSTWDLTTQDMKDDKDFEMYIANGIYIYWPNVTYTLNDEWRIELYPLSSSTQSKVGSMRITRW